MEKYIKFFESKNQIETPEFKKWFGNSQIADQDNLPLVVYHGSTQAFNEFKKETERLRNMGEVRETPFLQRGYFFSSSPATSESYSIKTDEPLEDIPKWASILKDLEQKVIDAAQSSNDALHDYAIKEFEKIYNLVQKLYPDFESQFYKGSIYPVYLKIEKPFIIDAKNGYWFEVLPNMYNNLDMSQYDGIIIKNVFETKEVQDTYIVFNQNQIKSAIGNTGSFDISSTKIHEMLQRNGKKYA